MYVHGTRWTEWSPAVASSGEPLAVSASQFTHVSLRDTLLVRIRFGPKSFGTDMYIRHPSAGESMERIFSVANSISTNMKQILMLLCT